MHDRSAWTGCIEESGSRTLDGKKKINKPRSDKKTGLSMSHGGGGGGGGDC